MESNLSVVSVNVCQARTVDRRFCVTKSSGVTVPPGTRANQEPMELRNERPQTYKKIPPEVLEIANWDRMVHLISCLVIQVSRGNVETLNSRH